jgi:hypothetical protein
VRLRPAAVLQYEGFNLSVAAKPGLVESVGREAVRFRKRSLPCLLFQLQRIPINLFAAHEYVLNIAGIVDVLGWITLNEE